ncbi:hypothetical protein PJIAN_4144 [Paludibacter jiangxiensis]|uniref:Uncharacterized protein n=1 Tax=Paludibacter jiangxiensis TaxID=681398 RepID=A0A161LF79_9BACT|nr:hypothetical protein PJIAN_4144 [Paludibacter jiangxiensis]
MLVPAWITKFKLSLYKQKGVEGKTTLQRLFLFFISYHTAISTIIYLVNYIEYFRLNKNHLIEIHYFYRL